jgi:hypothetical protein
VLWVPIQPTTGGSPRSAPSRRPGSGRQSSRCTTVGSTTTRLQSARAWRARVSLPATTALAMAIIASPLLVFRRAPITLGNRALQEPSGAAGSSQRGSSRS